MVVVLCGSLSFVVVCCSCKAVWCIVVVGMYNLSLFAIGVSCVLFVACSLLIVVARG